MQDFRQAALRELTDQQVRFAPPARRQEQIVRAQKLLRELHPAKLYPYPYICYRITDYRSDAYPDLLIPGSELAEDLALFIRKLERSIPPLPIEQAVEPMLTLEQISKQFQVSTKTISRWRVHGLIGTRIIRNGRRQLGFPQSMVERFLAEHPEQVARGAKFSHLSEEEREQILKRARRLAMVGGSLTEIARRIAKKLGRSVEAVRYTIKNYDRAHPEQPLFPALTGPLDGPAKQTIYNSYRRGTSVETLAKQYGRSRESLYRVINEVRAESLLKAPLDYIYNECFDDPSQEAAIMADMPDREKFEKECRSMKAPKDVPPELASLYEWPLLTKEQEQHLFRKMNFLKHKLYKLRQNLKPSLARVQDLKQIDELQAQIKAVKDLLVNCNMRLVVSIAKQHSTGDNLFELVSDGNMSLLRAVEKFDYSRGNKFSTYATWAIMKNFARSIPDEKLHRERYVTGAEEMLDTRADVRTDEQECLQQAEQARDRVNRLLAELDPRTREVIRMRAGLDGGEEMTLEQIGQHFGITKERVRQINVRGMKQLRDKALAGQADLL